jgi:membrane protease YdiL (CAAX protease family)
MACAAIEGVALAGVALAAAHLERRAAAERLRLGPSRATTSARVAAVLGVIGLTFACGAAADLAGAGHDGVMDLLAVTLFRPNPGRFLLALVTIAAIPAMGEEALFRGYIQTGLVQALGRWPAIVLTSIAFGVFHRDPVQGAGAFVAGLFLGWTTERTGGIGPAVVAHALNNATFVVLASFGAAGALARGVQMASTAIGVAACAAATFALARAPVRASTRAS